MRLFTCASQEPHVSNLALHNHFLYASSYLQDYIMRKQHHSTEKQVVVASDDVTGPRNIKIINKMRQPLPPGLIKKLQKF